MLVASTPRDLVATCMSECVCLSVFLPVLSLSACLPIYLPVCLSVYVNLCHSSSNYGKCSKEEQR